jgi:DNA-binding transcriptional LysR family regulator
VALLPTFLVADEIRDGNLVAPYGVRIGGPGAYYLVIPAAKARLPRVRAFRDWVLAQVSG